MSEKQRIDELIEQAKIERAKLWQSGPSRKRELQMKQIIDEIKLNRKYLKNPTHEQVLEVVVFLFPYMSHRTRKEYAFQITDMLYKK